MSGRCPRTMRPRLQAQEAVHNAGHQCPRNTCCRLELGTSVGAARVRFGRRSPPPVVDALAGVADGARRARPLGVLALAGLCVAGAALAAALGESARGLCAHKCPPCSATVGSRARYLLRRSSRTTAIYVQAECQSFRVHGHFNCSVRRRSAMTTHNAAESRVEGMAERTLGGLVGVALPVPLRDAVAGEAGRAARSPRGIGALRPRAPVTCLCSTLAV